MTQTPKYALMIFGGALFLLTLGALLWSLTRPPVTSGPEPPDPYSTAR